MLDNTTIEDFKRLEKKYNFTIKRYYTIDNKDNVEKYYKRNITDDQYVLKKDFTEFNRIENEKDYKRKNRQHNNSSIFFSYNKNENIEEIYEDLEEATKELNLEEADLEEGDF